jgi:hypothetical protein
MRKRSHKPRAKDLKALHPGSSSDDAREVGGESDFGAAENNRTARSYASENTKRADPGAAQPRSGSEGVRVSGAGGNDSGPGSSSGGDLDPDFIGLDKQGGVAQSGSFHELEGPDDVDSGSD